VPATSAALPEPIGWEQCGVLPGLAPDACLQMTATWPWRAQPLAYLVAADGSTGPMLLMVLRLALAAPEPWRMLVVGEADGPVRTALLETAPGPGCAIGFATQGALGQGRFVGFVRRRSAEGETSGPEVIFGGEVGAPQPEVLAVFDRSTGHAPATSATRWGTTELDRVLLAAPGQPLAPVHRAAASEGAQQRALVLWGETALWRSGNRDHAVLMAEQPGTEPRLLCRPWIEDALPRPRH
jgi:hypothetical protein